MHRDLILSPARGTIELRRPGRPKRDPVIRLDEGAAIQIVTAVGVVGGCPVDKQASQVGPVFPRIYLNTPLDGLQIGARSPGIPLLGQGKLPRPYRRTPKVNPGIASPIVDILIGVGIFMNISVGVNVIRERMAAEVKDWRRFLEKVGKPFKPG